MKVSTTLINTLLLATTAALHAAEGGSAQSAGAIQIAKFKGDRTTAVSMTLDDGLRNQDEFAVPLLNKYGIKATFYVIPGLTPETNDEAAKKKPGDHGGMSWLRLKELAAQGHEIANHTWTHLPLTKIKDGQRVDMEPTLLDAQIGKAYEAIKGHIGVAPFTFATPGNATSDGVRAAGHKYHPVLRERCERFGAWPPTSKDFTAAQANAMVDRYLKKGDALVWMMHAVTEGYNAFSGPDVLEDHLKYLRSKDDVLWIDTFAHVSRYTLERDAAKLTGSLSSDHAEFTLACPLDAALFHDPLTIVIPANQATQVEARYKKNGEKIPYEVRADKILVQVAPSDQTVEVTWRHAVK
jgi:peptidoglycan/xylan/chitin deacetylase (PgdA/CDA1 family)